MGKQEGCEERARTGEMREHGRGVMRELGRDSVKGAANGLGREGARRRGGKAFSPPEPSISVATWAAASGGG